MAVGKSNGQVINSSLEVAGLGTFVFEVHLAVSQLLSEIGDTSVQSTNFGVESLDFSFSGLEHKSLGIVFSHEFVISFFVLLDDAVKSLVLSISIFTKLSKIGDVSVEFGIPSSDFLDSVGEFLDFTIFFSKLGTKGIEVELLSVLPVGQISNSYVKGINCFVADSDLVVSVSDFSIFNSDNSIKIEDGLLGAGKSFLGIFELSSEGLNGFNEVAVIFSESGVVFTHEGNLSGESFKFVGNDSIFL